MDKFFSRRNLLFILATLVAARVFLMPVLEWQAAKLSELEGKVNKLDKMVNVVDGAYGYRQRLTDVEVELNIIAKHLHKETGNIKLDLQTSVEGLFEENNVEVERFSWLMDEPAVNGVRALRFLVGFNGNTDDLIRVMFKLANNDKVGRQVEWRNRISEDPTNVMGTSRGHITIEVYVISAEEVSSNGSVLVGNVGDNSGP